MAMFLLSVYASRNRGDNVLYKKKLNEKLAL